MVINMFGKRQRKFGNKFLNIFPCGKKGSINLAMSTIVIVIMGVVILTSGILLMKTFISGADDIKDQLDAQTESELERLLVDQGKKVALPLHTVTVEAGEDHIFGLGILNIDAEVYGENFNLDVALSKLVGGDNLEIAVSEDDVLSWLLYDTGEIRIEENEHHSEIIHVGVPETAAKGTYIFNVYVYYSGDSRYDSVKKLYVTVD
ncbi:hypothetical protein HOA92_06805 [archaeon]|jgi:hypothetical protein|nr:hypothetical protein [archaeon]